MNKSIFDTYNISDELNSAVAAMGFEEATPIQAQAIPPLLLGKDVIGQAQTGTGKTIAFGIPVIEKIDAHQKHTQAVVLAPTRELAIQVAEEFRTLLKFKKGINAVPIYGGQPIERQMHSMRKGAQIIIATPGRLIDHLQRKTVNLSEVKIVVLDEADIMLDMGFRDDIEKILKTTPKEKQTVFFSATMPSAILELTKKYQKNPEHIKVAHKEVTVPNVDQYYVEVRQGGKLDALSLLLDHLDPKLSLVFCSRKRGAADLVDHIQARGYVAEALHGDMRQSKRDSVMKKFRNGDIDILIATDVAARGIDVENIDAVFNFDMPQDEEYYVHRIGRTARAGRTGAAYTFVTGKELYRIKEIEKYTKTKIHAKKLPDAEEVVEKKTADIVDKVKESIGDGTGLAEYEKYVLQLMNEDFTSLEIATGLVKLLMKEPPKPQIKEYKEHEDRPRQHDFKQHKKRSFRKDDNKSFRRDDKKSFRKDDNRGFRKDDKKSFGKDDNRSFRKDDSRSFNKDANKPKSFKKDGAPPAFQEREVEGSSLLFYKKRRNQAKGGKKPFRFTPR